jgi:hypothetical protein
LCVVPTVGCRRVWSVRSAVPEHSVAGTCKQAHVGERRVKKMIEEREKRMEE